MKKFWGIIAASVLFVSLFGVPVHAGFSDTDDYDWKNSIHYLQEAGIVGGYADGSFKPDLKVNRAEFSRIVIGGLYEGVDDSYAADCFSDVAASDWFSKYVCFAKDEGFLSGHPDGSFKPGDFITQPEALRIIFNTLGEEVDDFGGEWYQQYLDYAEWLGMYYFDLDTPASHQLTRGEASYFIAWLLNENIGDQIESPDFYLDHFTVDQGDGYFTMDASECFEWETHNEETNYCELQCENEAECLALQDDIYSQAQNILTQGFDGFSHDHGADVYAEEASVSVYVVDGDEIVHAYNEPGLSGASLAVQNAKDKHLEVWNRFAELIPFRYRESLTGYEIFSDGYGGTMAAMAPRVDNPEEWILYVDPEDSHPDGVLDSDELTYTLIHEFAHYLTLNSSQVKPVLVEEHSEYLAEKADCYPNFYIEEGCSKSLSYINNFFRDFWADIYIDFIGEQEYEPGVVFESSDEFFEKYSDRFVTEYAGTNVGEDIAESFTAFVLGERPESSSIADKKVSFFYRFEELVALRKVIRQRL